MLLNGFFTTDAEQNTNSCKNLQLKNCKEYQRIIGHPCSLLIENEGNVTLTWTP